MCCLVSSPEQGLGWNETVINPGCMLDFGFVFSSGVETRSQ